MYGEIDKDKLKKIVADNIASLIKQSGKTQRDVAKAIDVPSQSLNNWIKGVSSPRMNKLQRLADYFDVKTSYFVEVEHNNYANIFAMLEKEFSLLNDKGKAEALKRIKELTLLSVYTEDNNAN